MSFLACGIIVRIAVRPVRVRLKAINQYPEDLEMHTIISDLPAPDVALTVLSHFLAHPNVYSLVAELDGRVVGSNFRDERSTIAASARSLSIRPCRIARLDAH